MTCRSSEGGGWLSGSSAVRARKVRTRPRAERTHVAGGVQGLCVRQLIAVHVHVLLHARAALGRVRGLVSAWAGASRAREGDVHEGVADVLLVQLLDEVAARAHSREGARSASRRTSKRRCLRGRSAPKRGESCMGEERKSAPSRETGRATQVETQDALSMTRSSRKMKRRSTGDLSRLSQMVPGGSEGRRGSGPGIGSTRQTTDERRSTHLAKCARGSSGRRCPRASRP